MWCCRFLGAVPGSVAVFYLLKVLWWLLLLMYSGMQAPIDWLLGVVGFFLWVAGWPSRAFVGTHAH